MLQRVYRQIKTVTPDAAVTIATPQAQVPAIINALTSIERLMELQALEEEPTVEPVTLTSAPGIVISHLSYAYPDSPEKVLDDFSCSFPAGMTSLIAGPTGIGKSTLLRLIMGLIQPSGGSVTIDGHPAGAALRGNSLYVPQGNTLLSGTIRSNLQMADPNASEEQMKDALKTAEAGFVLELPQGLDTPCGEVGGGFSEGQAQRICIARALLHPGSILVLDESSSALDAATEERLLSNIQRQYAGSKTILCISHRPAAERFADQVVVMPER